jgi:Tfp pilus assembly protein PilE
MSSLAKKIIIAIIIIVLIVIVASLGVSIYGWRAAVREGNKQATVQNLKLISAVEVQYYSTHNRTFGTFDQMIKEQILRSKFAGNPVTVDGYVLTLTVVPRTANVASSYTVRADPEARNDHFYIDSSDGLVHVNPNKPASPNDPESNY